MSTAVADRRDERGLPHGPRHDAQDALYKALGGNLARAARYLDAARYAESRCAFLCCRALDAFEDLAPDAQSARDGVCQATAYLLGRTAELPDTHTLSARRVNDALERDAARVLPELRCSLHALEAPARTRTCNLLERVSQAMVHTLEHGTRDARHYGSSILGPVSAYAFDLMGIATPLAADFAGIGVLLQAANDLRDLHFDALAGSNADHRDTAPRELSLFLRLAEHAPQAVGVLLRTRFPARSRARAAVAFLGVTTARFLAGRSGLASWGLLCHPRIAAGFAYASQGGYERILSGVEQAIHHCIVAVCLNHAGGEAIVAAAPPRKRSRLQSRFEARIAAEHPDPASASMLGHAALLINAALRLCGRLPTIPLGPATPVKPAAGILLVSDYLIACAAGMFSQLGCEALEEAGWSMMALVRASQDNGANGDSGGEVAALLGYLVGRARGLSVEVARECARNHQHVSIALHRADGARWPGPRLQRRHAARGSLWGDERTGPGAPGRSGASSEQLVRAEAPLLRRLEGLLERCLRLEHGANIFPLAHVVSYYAAFVMLAWPGVVQSLSLRIVLWCLMVIVAYSLSIGIIHLHAHRKLFTYQPLNRVLELLLCFPALNCYPMMRYVHVHLHHRFDDGPGDPTSTTAHRTGWCVLLYWARYSFRCKWLTLRALTARDAKPEWRRMRGQFFFDTLACTVIVDVWACFDWQRVLLLWLLPMVIVSVNIGFFAWLTHAPTFAGRTDHYFNTTNRWMNLLIHNQGYHLVHHRYPSVHWTAIPEHLDVMLEVDDRLIVPYWVLMPSAWHAASERTLRNEEYARSWKRRYRELRGVRRHRLRMLPYFCWI